MRFIKMQGLGNDYVYLDCTKAMPENLPALAVRLADRHFGVGGDGLICVAPSQEADFRMIMFNADGSESEMCGNGIRCVGKLIWDEGLSRKKKLTIETKAGIRRLTLHAQGGAVTAVTVDMGVPVLEPPCAITVKGREYTVTPVSMGNPHAILFCSDIDGLDLEDLGPGFENHPRFPNRTNTEFVQALCPGRLRMRVWERGSGETLACGTGACAALAAAAAAGLCSRSATVELRGGELELRWDERDGRIYMTGPAVTVFTGEF